MFGAKTKSPVRVRRSEPRFMLRIAMGLAVAMMAAITLTSKAIYDGPGVSDDVPVATMADYAGNVLVTGSSTTPQGGAFATVKYDNGKEVWSRRKFQGGPAAMVIDPWVFRGNVYVAGSTRGNYGIDYAIVAYDEDGNELWSDQYDRAFDEDRATSIALDLSGNVVVTAMRYEAGTLATD